MAEDLGICCKAKSNLEPYFLRIDGTELEVVQNEIVQYSANLILNKPCKSFENFKREVPPNSFVKVPISDSSVFLGIIPTFKPEADWNDRNLKFILGSEYDKINKQLNASKKYVVNLNEISNITTCSYNPTIAFPKKFEIEDVIVSIKDMDGNNIPFNLVDYKINFNDVLLGNSQYYIRISQTELIDNIPHEVITKNYTLNVLKNKIINYDFMDVVANDLNNDLPLEFFDVDDEYKIFINDVPKATGLEDIKVEFSGSNKILSKKRKISKDDDGKYNIEITVEIVGYLNPFEEYHFAISNIKNIFDNSLVPNKIYKFKTNLIHSSKTTINIAELFLLSSNKENKELDFLYLINDTNNYISVSGLIGYSCEIIESLIKNTKIC